MRPLASITRLDEYRERKYRPAEEYLTYAELSERLRRSTRALQRDVKAGMPVSLRFSGRCLFLLSECVAWHRRRS